MEFYVKYPLGKVVRKTLTFDQARLDIYTRRSKGRRLIYQMDFMRGKKEIASLTRQKRGFSSEELYMLMRNAEQAGIPCRYLK
ncbi:MAG TPA: hypothetical protein VHK69_01050 [Chitinophagaceae bacterium]|nr:hypothetical protein [Chitinophagaceae bacterium]